MPVARASLSRASLAPTATRTSRRSAAAVVAAVADKDASGPPTPAAPTTRRALLAAGAGLALAAGLPPRPAGAFIEAPPGACV
jgi:hypothetical protein